MYSRKIPRSSFMTRSAIGDDEPTTVDLFGVPIVTFPAQPATPSTTSTLMKYLPWAIAGGVAYWALTRRR